MSHRSLCLWKSQALTEMQYSVPWALAPARLGGTGQILLRCKLRESWGYYWCEPWPWLGHNRARCSLPVGPSPWPRCRFGPLLWRRFCSSKCGAASGWPFGWPLGWPSGWLFWCRGVIPGTEDGFCWVVGRRVDEHVGWGWLRGQVSTCHRGNVCLQGRDVPLPSSLCGRRSIPVCSATPGTRTTFVLEEPRLFTYLSCATSSSRATTSSLSSRVSDRLVSPRPCSRSFPTLLVVGQPGEWHVISCSKQSPGFRNTAWETDGAQLWQPGQDPH